MAKDRAGNTSITTRIVNVKGGAFSSRRAEPIVTPKPSPRVRATHIPTLPPTPPKLNGHRLNFNMPQEDLEELMSQD